MEEITTAVSDASSAIEECEREPRLSRVVGIPEGGFNCLVISGGGMKGIQILGALYYAYLNEMLGNVNTYIGTSIGAIIGYLMALGYTPQELLVHICTMGLLERLRYFNVVGALNDSGAVSYSPIQEALERLTIEKVGTFPTLGMLRSNFGTTLICSTYNVSKGKTEYLGPDTYPDMPCLVALRMSSNIPLVFERYKYAGSYYIDGGITDLFPAQIADEMGLRSLGFLSPPVVPDMADGEEFNFLQYVATIVYTPMKEILKTKLEKLSDKCCVVELDTDDVGSLDFSIGTVAKMDIFTQGFRCTKTFFESMLSA